VSDEREYEERVEGLRDRIAHRGEDAIGEVADALLSNPVFNNALGAALNAGERAAQAQKAAMRALGFSSSDEAERLERRLRSLSDRLEQVEDQLDELARDVSALRRKQASGSSSS
jgi:chromosome segregation ATPase